VHKMMFSSDWLLVRIYCLILYCKICRLKEMNNKSTKCLNALRTSGVERIFDAYKWVQEHRNEFHKEVYGPVLVEVYMLKSCFIAIWSSYLVC